MEGLILVTGGGSGMGRAVARELTASGSAVVILGRSKAKLEQTVKSGCALRYEVADVENAEGIVRVLDKVGGKQRINAVVHCAGIWTPGALADVSAETIDAHVRNVTLGSAYVLRAAVKYFADHDGVGTVVHVVAASAKPGFVDTALNTMAKRAVDGLHEGLLRELRSSAIRLTAIYPDSVADADSQAVAAGDAMSYDDVAESVMYALQSRSSVRVAEILLTAPNTGR